MNLWELLTYARIIHLKGNSAEILYLAEFRVPFQSNRAFNLQSSVLVKLKPILAEEIWFQLKFNQIFNFDSISVFDEAHNLEIEMGFS